MPRRKVPSDKAAAQEARICKAMDIERQYMVKQQMIGPGARKQLYKSGKRPKGMSQQLTQLHYMSNKGFSHLIRAISRDLGGDKPMQWTADALTILREHIGKVAVKTLQNARNAANFAHRSTVMPKDLIFLPMMCSHDINRYDMECGSKGPDSVEKYTAAYLDGKMQIDPKTGILLK